jgi:hypothetical protein
MTKNIVENKLSISPSKMYDLCAPAVYGKIMGMVQHRPIADLVHQKVFITAFSDKDYFVRSPRSPLITLLNASHTKSNSIMKALNILKDCCEQSGVCVTVKKEERP